MGVAVDRVGSWLRRATPRGELSSVALATLGHLDRSGPLRLTDLVAAEQITQPGMTGLVRRMAAAGLVTRQPDPTDGRAVLVGITDAGRATLVQVHGLRAAVVAEHLAALSPGQQAALTAAVEALEALADRPALPVSAAGGPRSEGEPGARGPTSDEQPAARRARPTRTRSTR